MSAPIRDDEGGPAFPTGPENTKSDPSEGMSLRDWFAGQTNVPWNAAIDTLRLKFPEKGGKFTIDELAATRAQIRYAEADAMLAARKERRT